MLESFDLLLKRLSTPAVVILTLLLVALIGIADWMTGTVISLSMLYIAPVALATWYANKKAGVIAAVVSITVWLAADVSMGLSFAHPVVPIWNALMRFGFLFIIVSLLSLLQHHLELEQKHARTDSLTGIANRRAFMEQLEYNLALSRRDGTPLTVTIVDLDDFKEINDTQGHNEGDKVLQRIAGRLRDNIRRTDVVARLGGDEFALLLPNTGLDGAKWMVTKVKRAVKSAVGVSQMATCSIGVVSFLSPPDTAEQAIRVADLLMYDVKNKGKNGVATLEVDSWPPNHDVQLTRGATEKRP
jgi:diguanylate cyclase (GGDEF)-like protein